MPPARSRERWWIGSWTMVSHSGSGTMICRETGLKMTLVVSHHSPLATSYRPPRAAAPSPRQTSLRDSPIDAAVHPPPDLCIRTGRHGGARRSRLGQLCSPPPDSFPFRRRLHLSGICRCSLGAVRTRPHSVSRAILLIGLSTPRAEEERQQGGQGSTLGSGLTTPPGRWQVAAHARGQAASRVCLPLRRRKARQAPEGMQGLYVRARRARGGRVSQGSCGGQGGAAVLPGGRRRYPGQHQDCDRGDGRCLADREESRGKEDEQLQ